MNNIEKSREELLQELLELKQENESLKIIFQKCIAKLNPTEMSLRVSENYEFIEGI
ncbi:MAG: hypothetical protein HW421_1986 [Ignavibacteria bacterium]|nr:hypothetical protein [Ignavibacteria bacterium]